MNMAKYSKSLVKQLELLGITTQKGSSPDTENNLTPFQNTRFNTSNKIKCTIFGVGGIGSYVAHFLAGLNVDLKIYDKGCVEYRNILTQLYFPNDIGESKVIATERSVKYSSCFDTLVTPIQETLNSENIRRAVSGVYSTETRFIISAVDSLDLRILIANACKEHRNVVFIDGRMGITSWDCFICSTPEDYETYLTEYCLTDAEVTETHCTQRATKFMGGMIGSFIVNAILNHVNTDMPIPFKTTFNNMLLCMI